MNYIIISTLLCVFLFFLQFLEFLFRNVLQQVLLDIVLGRQLEAVFADEEILRETLSGVLYGGHAIVGTQQQADRRVVVRLHHLMLVVVHVKIQLRGIFVAESVNLQIDNDVAFQDAVVENKVGLEIVLIDENSLLASLEAETAAHLQQECLQVIQDVRLQLGFRIDFLRLYPQKFERHRVVLRMLTLRSFRKIIEKRDLPEIAHAFEHCLL